MPLEIHCQCNTCPSRFREKLRSPGSLQRIEVLKSPPAVLELLHCTFQAFRSLTDLEPDRAFQRHFTGATRKKEAPGAAGELQSTFKAASRLKVQEGKQEASYEHWLGVATIGPLSFSIGE